MSDIVERLRRLANICDEAVRRTAASITREAAAEITSLRAELAEAQRERDGFREECQRRRFDLLDAERDRDAAKAEAERLREALATARGLYQVTHIHAAIDAALGEPQ